MGSLIFQSNEVKQSNAMEREGLQRAIDNLFSKGLEIGTLITDRHVQIAKYLWETHPEIEHRYDAWHMVKGNYNCLTVKVGIFTLHFFPSFPCFNEIRQN